MKHVTILGFTLFILSSFAFAQEKFSTQKISDDISLKVPQNLNQLGVGSQASAFSGGSLASFASQDGEAILGVNKNQMIWEEGKTELIRNFYRANFNSMFDKISYLQDTIQEINGNEFIVFEFEGTVENENVFGGAKNMKYYSYIQYTRKDGQVLLFNFGCKSRIASRWQTTAKTIMQSVKVKK